MARERKDFTHGLVRVTPEPGVEGEVGVSWQRMGGSRFSGSKLKSTHP